MNNYRSNPKSLINAVRSKQYKYTYLVSNTLQLLGYESMILQYKIYHAVCLAFLVKYTSVLPYIIISHYIINNLYKSPAII